MWGRDILQNVSKCPAKPNRQISAFLMISQHHELGSIYHLLGWNRVPTRNIYSWCYIMTKSSAFSGPYQLCLQYSLWMCLKWGKCLMISREKYSVHNFVGMIFISSRFGFCDWCFTINSFDRCFLLVTRIFILLREIF